MLATGGLTRLFRRNSASVNMGGDGYALALRAGASLIDMEFVQFFPIGHLAPRLVGMDPIMWDPFRYKLGGRLLNGRMEEFTSAYGSDEDGKYILTRDLATYAILKEVEAGRGSPHGGAYLSFQHCKPAALREAFGPVIDRLAANGIDLIDVPVEVAPIAHYHMGGVKADAAMATDVPRLFVAGEIVGGAHGANRLSGNALTEAFVFGRRAGRSAAACAAKSMRQDFVWQDAAPRLTSCAPTPAARVAPGTATPPKWRHLYKRLWPTTLGRSAPEQNSNARWTTSPHLPASLASNRSDAGTPSTANGSIGLTCATCWWPRMPSRKRRRTGSESRGAHQREDFPDMLAALAGASARTACRRQNEIIRRAGGSVEVVSEVATLKVRRGGARDGERWESFKVPFEPGQSVLDGLRWLRIHKDPSLAVRFSCINANACKECMIQLDGETVYACIATPRAARDDVDATAQ